VGGIYREPEGVLRKGFFFRFRVIQGRMRSSPQPLTRLSEDREPAL